MKKYGFSLSEILIALAVVGIVAAIITPMSSAILPDKNKIEVLKAYNALSETTQNLLNNSMIYYDYVGDTNKDSQEAYGNYHRYKRACQGLGCAQRPYRYDALYYHSSQSFAPKKKTTGNSKYPNLMLVYLATEDTNIVEKKYYEQANSTTDYAEFQLSPSISCKIKLESGTAPNLPYISSTGLTYNIELTIPRKDNKDDCSYSTSCLEPNQYKFLVNNFGEITGNDSLTKAYLLNPNKFNDRKTDFAKAEELESSSNSNQETSNDDTNNS